MNRGNREGGPIVVHGSMRIEEGRIEVSAQDDELGGDLFVLEPYDDRYEPLAASQPHAKLSLDLGGGARAEATLDGDGLDDLIEKLEAVRDSVRGGSDE